MSQKKAYGQFCPVAQAAEILAERWTPLVIRELCCGATRFNDLQRGLPRMSSALLSRRLRELEHAGIIRICPAASGKGSEYLLTDAGAAMFPIIEAMGDWASRWLRGEATAETNLDPDLLMWDVRRRVIRFGDLPAKRRVVEFQFSGVPVSRRFYWLVMEPAATDLCVRNPGHAIDLYVGCHLRTLTRVWLGQVSIAEAIRDGSLRLDGSRAEIDAFGKWFTLSHFARGALRAQTGTSEGTVNSGGVRLRAGPTFGLPP